MKLDPCSLSCTSFLAVWNNKNLNLKIMKMYEFGGTDKMSQSFNEFRLFIEIKMVSLQNEKICRKKRNKNSYRKTQEGIAKKIVLDIDAAKHQNFLQILFLG